MPLLGRAGVIPFNPVLARLFPAQREASLPFNLGTHVRLADASPVFGNELKGAKTSFLIS